MNIKHFKNLDVWVSYDKCIIEDKEMEQSIYSGKDIFPIQRKWLRNYIKLGSRVKDFRGMTWIDRTSFRIT